MSSWFTEANTTSKLKTCFEKTARPECMAQFAVSIVGSWLDYWIPRTTRYIPQLDFKFWKRMTRGKVTDIF